MCVCVFVCVAVSCVSVSVSYVCFCVLAITNVLDNCVFKKDKFLDHLFN